MWVARLAKTAAASRPLMALLGRPSGGTIFHCFLWMLAIPSNSLFRVPTCSTPIFKHLGGGGGGGGGGCLS